MRKRRIPISKFQPQDVQGMSDADLHDLRNRMNQIHVPDLVDRHNSVVGEMRKRGLRLITKPLDKAKWSTAYVNSLPDSSFAYIEPGGKKDDQGKTTPRSLRHFPYKDKQGNVDLPHLRNALSRAPQSPFGPKAMPKLKAAAKRAGVGEYTKQQALVTAVPLESDGVCVCPGCNTMRFNVSGQVCTTLSCPECAATMVDGTDPYNRIVEKTGIKPPTLKTIGEKPALPFRVTKTEDQQIVSGVVYAPEEVDGHGEGMTAGEIQKTAFDFMEEFGDRPKPFSINHETKDHAQTLAHLLESFISPVDFIAEDGQPIRKGSWIMSARVVDPEVWDSIKAGELTGWSMGGFAEAVVETPRQSTVA